MLNNLELELERVMGWDRSMLEWRVVERDTLMRETVVDYILLDLRQQVEREVASRRIVGPLNAAVEALLHEDIKREREAA